MHWTYAQFKDSDDLCQGDVLEPSTELSKLFREVHPHFCDSKYRNFLILTQSCDLVRRPKYCSATHISLSVVRSLSDIIKDPLKDKFGFLSLGIYDENMKKDIKQMTERIVNQNENILGLFYLHPDADAGISVPSVAILRVSVSVRSREHYETLMKSRVGRLSKEFQPKLGWMTGNLYSRVGVTDWKEESSDYNEQKIINDILGFAGMEPLWVKRKIYNIATKKFKEFDRLSPKEQKQIIKDLSPPPPKQQVIEKTIEIINSLQLNISGEEIEKIKNRLLNDDPLEATMRRFYKEE